MRSCTVLAIVVLLATLPRSAGAYSVLAHEALIDLVWDEQLVPLLQRRFPDAAPEAIQNARAFAYGGVLIQDLGYYPFGSRLFTNLVHYVRTGDFVAALIAEARDANEYAFALGALAHYCSDNAGHPIAVNRAVPILFPKEAARHGAEVLYADSPKRHLMAEFAFDVTQVASGRFKADTYQKLIGFEVAKDALDRAFRKTYGLALKDLFGSVDLAIGTYRYAASKTIPDMTRMAWRDKRDEILEANPGITEREFVYNLTPQQYDETFGTDYRKPSFLARLVVTVFKVIPKFGPFKPLAFEPLTAETEKMFRDSFEQAGARYRELLGQIAAGEVDSALEVEDTDLDTGKPPSRGRNAMSDDTHAKLLATLAKSRFEGTPPELRQAINDYYAMPEQRAAAPGRLKAAPTNSRDDRRAMRHLAALNRAP
jgi:hypothetical protein